MNRKFALGLLVLVTAVASAHLGCVNDACDNADNQVSNCEDAAMTGISTNQNAVTQACAGVRLCQSNCINRSTCAEILGYLPDYAACISACDGQP